MDIAYDFYIFYPQLMGRAMATPGRTFINLNVSLQGTGRLYCRAIGHFETNVDSTWYSPNVLKSVGVSLSILSSGNYTVHLPDLSPSSTYDVYCYSEDFNGVGMSTDAVVATK
eukprot:gene18324-13170_t